MQAGISRKNPLLTASLAYSVILKMEAISASETSVNYGTIKGHASRSQNLTSHTD
jgi:hypothetical protein